MGLLAFAILRGTVAAASGGAAQPYPLDPLTASEFRLAVRLLKASPECPSQVIFPSIALSEPPKQALSGPAVSVVHREVSAVVLDKPSNRTFEATVDLTTRSVTQFRARAGVQPAITQSDFDAVVRLTKADPRWQAAIRRRGMRADEVVVDGWATGTFAPKESRGKRLMRGVCYLKSAGATNFYGRPVEGLVSLVNLTDNQVLDVVDVDTVPVEPTSQELNPKALSPLRADLKPLKIVTPQGPSFELRGHEVRWQKWHFRFGVNAREGLVLYTVAYEDGGKLRSILNRGSLSETVVPYGDPRGTWSFRNAFDEGEYGLGTLMVPLQPGADAPENAVLLDAIVADELGVPRVIKGAVGLYERNGGLLWRHSESGASHEARPARELVLTATTNIGNYDYSLGWIFHQDGSLDVDVGLSGIMLPQGVAASTHDTLAHGAHGHLVAPHVAAPHHQHFMNFRLDFDVDGPLNSVAELNTGAMPPDAQNPDRNGILMEEHPLATELEARRDLNLATARKWKVFNPAVRNKLGYPTAYLLIPADNAVPYLAEDSPVRKRASFINHHLWVTRYEADERYAAGNYPNQAENESGLPLWAGNDESLAQQDLVVWYTLGTTHIPRPEEWPVMSVTHAGFKLAPAGFFDRNPALDVPR